MQLYCMNRADNGELNEKNGIDRSLSFWAGSCIKKRDTGSGYDISEVEDGRVSFWGRRRGNLPCEYISQNSGESSSESRQF